VPAKRTPSVPGRLGLGQTLDRQFCHLESRSAGSAGATDARNVSQPGTNICADFSANTPADAEDRERLLGLVARTPDPNERFGTGRPGLHHHRPAFEG